MHKKIFSFITIIICFFIITLLVSCLVDAEDIDNIPATATTEEGSQEKIDAVEKEKIIIEIQNSKFSPGLIEIEKGSTVIWVNQDSYAHTVTSGERNNPDGIFDSGSINGGESFSMIFEVEGIYYYYCEFHEDMKGKIIVKK